MKQQILNQLLLSRGEFISGAKLANITGVSRVAVWKHMGNLKQEGYNIISVKGKGYQLLQIENIIIPEIVADYLQTENIGRKVFIVPQIDSTNNRLKAMLQEQSLPTGTVLVAASQNSGKGRRGRSWISPPGGLWFSVLLRPPLDLARTALLSLVFAVACTHALQHYTEAACQIKWPNDLLIGGKKVGGILLELEGEIGAANYLIVGIGINVNLDLDSIPVEIRDYAISMQIAEQKNFELNHILATVLNEMERYYERFLAEGITDIMQEFCSLCYHLGQEVRVDMGSRILAGVNIGIDEQGSLLIDTGEQICKVSTGDVSVVSRGEL
ncbi:MAG: biotin--[acetyl-CoA-carboxylase] ligase [Syntrophomonadaceae bacterium]|nr:biotin--[acetyl-CoA-carboxylase] ligase [Syntrophomonadaceae bacterium]